MKRSVWLILIALVIVLGLLAWFLFDSDQEKPVAVAPKAPVVETKADAPVLINKVIEREEDEEEFNPYESEVVKAQIAQVADLYAENIQYPITSQPVRNPEDVRDFAPFEQSEVDLPFFEDPDDQDEEAPIRLSAATDSFQYFQGEKIAIRLRVSNAPKETFVSVTGTLAGSKGDLPLDVNFEPRDRSLTEFNATVDTNLAPTELMTPEMLVKLFVKIGDRDLATTVAFRYAIPSAQIIGIGHVRPEGAELLIPLQYNIFQSGYYFVQAVLEDATTGQPLIQLQGEQRIAQGNGVINLKAHIAALKVTNSEGPYVLRSIRTYRGAEVGEDFDAPGSTAQRTFNIQGFPFSAYQDVEYVDQEGIERLEFLRGLGAVDEAAVFEREQQRKEEDL